MTTQTQKRTKKFIASRSEKIEPSQVLTLQKETNIELLLAKYLKHCGNQGGLTPKTIKTYGEFSRRFINFIKEKYDIQDVDKVDEDIIEFYIDYLKNERKIKPITVNTTIINLRPFFNWLVKKKYINQNPFNEIKKLRVDKQRKPPLTPEQVDLLLRQQDLSCYVGIRDNLIIRLLFGTGVRISEALSLRIKDINFKDQTIYIPIQKNREDSFIPIPKTLVKPLKEYILTWLSQDNKENYLFQNSFGEELKYSTIRGNLNRYAKSAKLDRSVSCHIFRHTYAIEFLRNGGSTASLRRQMRQHDLKVIEEYLNWLPDIVVDEGLKYNPLDRMIAN